MTKSNVNLFFSQFGCRIKAKTPASQRVDKTNATWKMVNALCEKIVRPNRVAPATMVMGVTKLHHK
ncbi:hypothetical protein, partial [Elstera litoralis]|uniref:hypothetical protein n=1 Tax=Elstera litoralis TaxID=552518 RepID=UPI001E658AB0